MEIKIREEGRQIRVEFKGNILFQETTDLGIRFDELLQKDFDEAVLSFSEVTGITSSAIGAVIKFHEQLKKRGSGMRIVGMSEKAYSVFKYFKLDGLFSIER